MFKKIPGPVCMVIAAILFALGGLLIKLIPWNALAINGARSILAVGILYGYCRLTHHPLKFNKTVFVGAFCLTATNILYSMANKLTTAGNTIILQFTAPIFVLIWGFLIFHRKPKKMDLIACAVVFFGVMIFFIDSLSAGNMLGNFLAVASGMTYAGLFMMNEGKDADPLTSVIIGAVMGIVIGLPWLVKVDFAAAEPSTWAALLALGIFQLGLAYVFFTEGLKTTPSITASLLSAIEAILNPILVAVVMHEMLTPLSMVGAVIVFVSVVTYNVLAEKQKQQKA
ncbi:MAG: EamA family transporter [Firmicutes bacterium]|nr:EamA family transporter [Bacillota bacterium]